VSLLLVAPILIPLATAIVAVFLRSSVRTQRAVNAAGVLLLLFSSVRLFHVVNTQGVQATQLGGWPAPFGITFVADLLGALMVLLCGLVGAAAVAYSLASPDVRNERLGFHPMTQILLMGVNGAFLTGDIFNLYVWFEVLLIASFVLLSLGGSRAELEGGMKYVTLNLVSSLFFLSGVGVLYGLAGTLNMADLHGTLDNLDPPGAASTIAILFLVAFGIKAAVFPMFFWLPASYHTPPVAVSALFAGLLTKVGVYALLRTFTLLFDQDVGLTHSLILVLAAFTMVTGVLGAVAQNDFRKILSFHIISQIGYMILGLGLLTPLAIAGSIFYVAHHIIVKTNLFFVSGIAQFARGTSELKRLGGLYGERPFLAALFLIPALSLAGVPPLSGFWAKLILIRAGLETEQYLLVGIALLVGLLTLFSMSKIWLEAFWKPQPEDATVPEPRPRLRALYWPVIAFAVITAALGLYAQPLFDVSMRAAEQLLDPTPYIQAVLGGTP
jgi:multicomponent Na+:H+ antiporter subunit D